MKSLLWSLIFLLDGDAGDPSPMGCALILLLVVALVLVLLKRLGG